MALAFKLHIGKEQIEGKEQVPQGVYKVRFSRFNPQWTRQNQLSEQQWIASRSINLNGEYEILEHPDYAGRVIYDTLNVGPKTPLFGLTDMCHGFGLPLDYDPATEQYDIPGMDSITNSPGYDPEKPETWDYRGPLMGRTAQIEIGHSMFKDKPQVKPRRWFCSVPDCAKNYPMIRHSQNLIRA
jgi:hypothetical protein